MKEDIKQAIIPVPNRPQPAWNEPEETAFAFLQIVPADQTMDACREQIITVLQDLIQRYTAGGSTSVRVETAERLLRSLLLAVNAAISSPAGRAEARRRLREKPFRELYREGVQNIAASLAEAKEMYTKVRRGKLPISLASYNSTINEALPEFFLTYKVLFGAHEIIAGIDYPLLRPVPDLPGVFYIHRYLKQLALENEICRRFPPEEIRRLLESFGRINRIDYRVSMVNICETVVGNAVFATLSGRAAGSLLLTPAEAAAVERQIAGLDPAETEAAIRDSLARIVTDLSLDPETAEYVRSGVAELALRVRNAAECSSLGNLILTEAAPGPSGPVFLGGARMDDRTFAAVCRRIAESRNKKTKAAVILAEVNSPEDLVDVLEADCLYGEEYTAVFRRLDVTTLAVLGRVVFEAELRAGPLRLAALGRREEAAEWQERFVDYLNSLNRRRKEAVEEMINTLRIV